MDRTNRPVAPSLKVWAFEADAQGATAYSVTVRKEATNVVLSARYARSGNRLFAVPVRKVGVGLLSLPGTAEPLVTAVRL